MPRKTVNCVKWGSAILNPRYRGRRALASGLGVGGRSHRVQHARQVRWLTAENAGPVPKAGSV